MARVRRKTNQPPKDARMTYIPYNAPRISVGVPHGVSMQTSTNDQGFAMSQERNIAGDPKALWSFALEIMQAVLSHSAGVPS